MLKKNPPSVEKMTRVGATPPIERIPDDRVPKMLEMDANLVGAPRAGTAFHERLRSLGGDDPKTRDRFASALRDGHLLTVHLMP